MTTQQQAAWDAAIEALENSSLEIIYLHEKFKSTGTGEQCVAKNNAALRLLRPPAPPKPL